VTQPQRPYVPHRTPNKPRPAPGLTEFHLTRPFVAGDERTLVAAGPAAIQAGNEHAGAGLPSIEDFLQPGPAATARGVEAAEEPYGDFDERDELPPVEHFLDPLPPVSHFADDFPSQLAGGAGDAVGRGGDPKETSGEEGWLESTWQNYDWRAAAALGESGESEASNAWAETDWDTASPRANASRPTAAQAIASALDEIARRIRDGELVVPPAGLGVAPDPSTVAATLASLLGIRK
jgi:hypothetical protein